MTEKESQVLMHKDFFDRIDFALANGFHLEAIFCEYAAIEGRLEVLCGQLGCPCNKYIPNEQRKDVKIGNRVKCLKKLYKKHPACVNSTTKMTSAEWKALEAWIKDRNIYVHGLYKNPDLYKSRLKETEEQALKGSRLARLLYNEAKRIGRVKRDHPERMNYEGACCTHPCYIRKET